MNTIHEEEKQSWVDYIWSKILLPLVGSFAGVAFAIYMAPLAVEVLSPTSRYYSLRLVTVTEAPNLEDYRVFADRAVWKDFAGEFMVTVRRDGLSRPICATGNEFPYRARTKPSDDPDGYSTVSYLLAEWMGEGGLECLNLIKVDVSTLDDPHDGLYVMETCIRVKDLMFDPKPECAKTYFYFPQKTEETRE